MTSNRNSNDIRPRRSLTVAASNEEEKERWLEDLSIAIAQADADPKMPYLNLQSCSKYSTAVDHWTIRLTKLLFVEKFCQVLGSADEMGDGIGLDGDRGNCGGAKASNTTVHVCWHRNTSISYNDQLRAFQVIIIMRICGNFSCNFLW